MSHDSVVCIVIAAGEGKRWNNYLGCSKHFIKIDGEPIVSRTVRLAERYRPKIYVVGNSPDFQVNGTTLFYPELNPLNHDADKFLSSASLWNRAGRTVVFYGDVYFSEDAMQRIMEYEPREWALFARFGASRLTGKKYGECFAQSFYSEHIDEHAAAFKDILSAYLKKEIKRCGGWEHYRSMEKLPLRKHQRDGRLVVIDDWTEDFDHPLDYDRWLNLRHARGLPFIFYGWLRRFLNAKIRRTIIFSKR